MMRGRRSARGFTLVEILVVMTLMSVVMLALGAAMRTIAQTEERVDQRLQRDDEMRVATSFLSSTLGRISPRRSPTLAAAGGNVPLFAAAPAQVMWVGVMPARYGAGGRYFFRIALERQADRSDVVIRFAPWTPAGAFPAWGGADSRPLLRAATGFALEYQQPDGSWRGDWADPQTLPGRIRISLRTAAVEWPPIVIALRQLPAGDNGRGGFSLGPE
ncbi:type II secretion system protein J [Caenimonas terrae]|uniref:Type II secretion system protein J n=1 Tax=Caenimonas terrae TaxID=696074 RepID=A0ABW0NMY6_9BURK